MQIRMVLISYILGRCLLIGILICPWNHTKKIEKSKQLMMYTYIISSSIKTIGSLFARILYYWTSKRLKSKEQDFSQFPIRPEYKKPELIDDVYHSTIRTDVSLLSNHRTRYISMTSWWRTRWTPTSKHTRWISMQYV